MRGLHGPSFTGVSGNLGTSTAFSRPLLRFENEEDDGKEPKYEEATADFLIW